MVRADDQLRDVRWDQRDQDQDERLYSPKCARSEYLDALSCRWSEYEMGVRAKP